ncbi:hypothetical protein BH18ACT4_BH18ACT4_15770 [soil metagenome]
MKIVVLAPDLMDQSRIRAATAAHDAVFVGRPEALAAAADDSDLVIVDLSRRGVLDVLGAIGPRTIGFGSHVDHELLAAAAAAGCDEVLPRSQFFRRLPVLVA